jgi:hypothetical protein
MNKKLVALAVAGVLAAAGASADGDRSSRVNLDISS